MASKCNKCEKEDIQPSEAIKCCECASVFHTSCAGLSSTTRSISKVRQTWKCGACVSESSSTSSRTGPEKESSVLEAIAAFRKEFNSRADASDDRLEKMQDQIKTVAADVSDLKAQNEELRRKLSQAEEDLEVFKDDNKRLISEVVNLKNEVNDLQQHSRKNNIIVSGVPVTAKENVFSVLDCLARVLDVPFKQEISAAHRLQGRRGDTRPPSIVVSFISRSTKAAWIDARRQKKRLSARELHSSFPDEPVYVNDHLTTQTRELFNAARALLKSNQLAAVWTNDCRVLIKRTPTERPFRVTNLEQLNVIKKAATVGNDSSSSTAQAS